MKHLLLSISFFLISIFGFSQTLTFSPQNVILCHWDTCVAFMNQTPNVTSSSWNFGDPTSGPNNTSTLLNPTHCFAGGAGTYTINLTCTFVNSSAASATGTIILTADSAAFTWSSSANNTISFTDISGGSPVIWNWDMGDATFNNIPNPTHLYASSGFYNAQLVILTSYGCLDTTVQTVNAIPLGISNLQTTSSFSFYPNPSSTKQIHLVMDENSFMNRDLKIENILGKIVFEKEVFDNTDIDLSLLNSGIYFIRIGNGEAKKLVIE